MFEPLYCPQFHDEGFAVRATFFLAQGVVVALVSLFTAYFWPQSAVSALLGGAIAITGTLVFAAIVFARKRMRPKNAMRVLVMGEVAKIAVIAGLFLAALHLTDIHLLAFLGGFFSAYVVYFLAPVLLRAR